MRTASIVLALGVALAPRAVRAAGPTVAFTLPAQDTTPSVFGSLPFPNDLYFDQGKPADGDGTLLNAGLPSGAKMGLAADVARVNPAVVENALDTLDGFGTTSAIYFFFSGAIDSGSLPTSPVRNPSLSQSVFCADATTAVPVPISLQFDVDTRIPHVLAVQPLAGHPLKPKTRYTCVVRRSVTGGGEPVEPSADWTTVRDAASLNTDADDIYDPVVTRLGTAGVPASEIAGMTVFTTESTVADLETIRSVVLPAQPAPTADFASRPELVFDSATELTALLGSLPHTHVAKVATGFFHAPRFQSPDPNGDGADGDVPIPPDFASCAVPCESADEAFVRGPGGQPVVIDSPSIPFTVVVPAGTPPAGGWPVVIQQHGLGEQRDVVVRLGEAVAAKGFASIGIDAVAHGYRFVGCGPGAPCAQDTANNFGGTAVPDGFTDGSLAGYPIDVISGNLGFLEAFHNLLAVRDHVRQTVVDLFSLVRLLQGHSIDTALGAPLDTGHIFYVGHALGGVVGADFVALEPSVGAAVLNGAGADVATRMFLDSPYFAGSLEVGNGVLGLDPANVTGDYALAFNLVQTVMDPADAANAAGLLLAPPSGGARNVVLVEDLGDEAIPTASTESLAVAAGLPLLDPFVQNLGLHAVTATAHTVRANVAGGTATAALLQTGIGAADGAAAPGTVTRVPGFPHWEEVDATGELYPALLRPVRAGSTGVVDAALGWFRDVVANGTPGRFSYTATPAPNPAANVDVPAGASTQTFFAGTVNQGGAVSGTDPTSDVTVAFTSNLVPSRVTVARSVLGTTVDATDADVPPGPGSTVGTLGVLPFFVTLQREIPGTFSANVTIAYTVTELGIAAVPPASPEEAALVVAAFVPGTCAVGGAACEEDAACGADGPCVGATYAALPTSIDTVNHRATASGVSADVTLAILHPEVLLAGYHPPLIAGGAGAISDCRGEWAVANALNVPFRDSKGRVNPLQLCHDGDVTCDADRTVNGSCQIRVGICYNYPDPILPLCTTGIYNTTAYRISKPRSLAKKQLDRDNANRLLNAIVALGGVRTGVKQDEVQFTPPFSNGRCTEMVNFQVDIPAARPLGKSAIRGISSFNAGPLDAGGDRLRVRCFPAQ